MSRRRRALLVAVAFVIGVGLMVPFEATITRVLGVAFLVAFIVAGVFLIAEPGFLSADEDSDPATGGDMSSSAGADGGPETMRGR